MDLTTIEKCFTWLDEDDVRCGPRHRTLKAAFNFKRAAAENTRWVEEREEKYPSNKPPHRLVVAELVEREMNAEEKRALELFSELHNMGMT